MSLHSNKKKVTKKTTTATKKNNVVALNFDLWKNPQENHYIKAN